MQCVREACCAMCVCRPRAHSTTTSFFADRSRLQHKKRGTQSIRVSMLQQSTKHTAVSSMLLPTVRRMTLPAFAAAWTAVNARPGGSKSSECVGRAVRCACVAPEPTTRRILLSLTGRDCRENTQHTDLPRQHAAVVVDKAHGGVIDVASAPCQPSTAWLCRLSPRPRVGMASPQGPIFGERQL